MLTASHPQPIHFQPAQNVYPVSATHFCLRFIRRQRQIQFSDQPLHIYSSIIDPDHGQSWFRTWYDHYLIDY